MSLDILDFEIPTKTVTHTVFKDGKPVEAGLTVRGLSINDVMVLMAAHGESLTELFGMFAGPDGVNIPEDKGAFVLAAILQAAPSTAAAIIARAADRFDDATINKLMKLPAEFQLRCLEAIAELTFVTEESLGNVVRIVVSSIQATIRQKEKLTSL